MTCVGSGQRRFKFQEEKRFAMRNQPDKDATPNADIVGILPTRSGEIRIRIAPDSPVTGPSNELSLLASALIKAIHRSTDFRYNLWWSFGMFLEDVPRRLGTNEALDRAIDAVTCAHVGFCVGRVGTVEALTKYSQALRTLRVYLDDRVHAQSSNTLCAVMVLLICQTFMGPSNRTRSGHAEGAAQILKVRRYFGPRDHFEKKLFLSLRGSVVGILPYFSYEVRIIG